MKKRNRKHLCPVVLLLLLAAAVCSLVGCAAVNVPALESPEMPTVAEGQAVIPPEAGESTAQSDVQANVNPEALQDVTEFTFEVTGADGITVSQIVSTNCKTVGEALLAYGMIAGDEGPYGLYVKTVLGETHEYETDGKYWAFYIDGQYAASGVERTEIVPGSVYAFRAE